MLAEYDVFVCPRAFAVVAGVIMESFWTAVLLKFADTAWFFSSWRWYEEDA